MSLSNLIEWLHFLSRFDAEAPLLVLGIARSEELDAAHSPQALVRHQLTPEEDRDC